jgi:pimeloyl-ACP methyl ester carboxylesterase
MTMRKDGAVRRRTGGLWARLAAGAGVVSLLAACSAGAPETESPQVSAPSESPQDSGDAGTATPEASEDATQDAPQGATAPEGLETFYSQTLEWSECDGGECATLTVPIDYADPEGSTIELALLRAPATGERQGSLMVNPGGPGASGVEYARLAEFVVSPEVAEAYDIVGFDPRGVAGSAPITCFDDGEMDEFLGADPSPDTPEEEAETDELVRSFAQACAEAAPELLGHVSTVEAARDMDVLRAALGEDTTDYLGASYGTYLGATYAELFPEQVGRLVLDGALDPNLSGLEIGLGQAAGFEQATRSYVQHCLDEGDCPLGDSVDAGMQRITDFLDEVDQQPLPVDGDAIGELTEGWALLGIIVAMYDESAWDILTQALGRAFDGDGSMLMLLANIYADRNADGTYNGNSMQAIYAVNCLDRPAGEDERTDEEILAEFEEVAPTFGRYLAGEGACGVWEAEAAQTLDDYSAAGAAPIVVIGTTGDPATPYQWAGALAETLESGVLVSYEGEGHTAYGRSNDCIDGAVDAFLLEGTVPEDGLTC